jgi:hypothetical protein
MIFQEYTIFLEIEAPDRAAASKACGRHSVDGGRRARRASAIRRTVRRLPGDLKSSVDPMASAWFFEG